MEQLFEIYKFKTFTHQDGVEGQIVGYCDNNLIGACECNPIYSFRRLDKNTYIDEAYKDTKYRYFYVSEKTAEQCNTPTNKSPK